MSSTNRDIKPNSKLKLTTEEQNPNFNPNYNSDLSTGKIDEYLIGKEIGKGSYAIVKQAMHKITGQKYAIKVYERSKLSDPAKKSTVKREIQILKKLNNAHTIKLYDVIETTKYVYKYNKFVIIYLLIII